MPASIFQATFYFVILQIVPKAFDSSASLLIFFGISMVNTIISLTGLASTYFQVCFHIADSLVTSFAAGLFVTADVVMRSTGFAFAAYILGKILGKVLPYEDDVAVLLGLIIVFLFCATLSFLSSLAFRNRLGLGRANMGRIAISSVLNLFSPYTLFFGRKYLVKTLTENFIYFAIFTAISTLRSRLRSPTESGIAEIDAIERVVAWVLLFSFCMRNIIFVVVILRDFWCRTMSEQRQLLQAASLSQQSRA